MSKDAKNRLEEAKKLVGGLIDQMDSGMTAMIISFADTPQVVQEFTDNRRLLRERLATIEPTVRGTDLRGALDLADGLANPGRSPPGRRRGNRRCRGAAGDGLYLQRRPIRGRQGFFARQLSKPIYVPIGSFEAKNLAITGFTTRRSEAKPEERQAFVQVANFTEAAQKGGRRSPTRRRRFSMRRKSRCRRANRAAWFCRWPMRRPGKLTARLKYELDTPASATRCEQDDIGYAALNDAKPGRVLVVTPGNVALEVALATERCRASWRTFELQDARRADDRTIQARCRQRRVRS